MSTTYPSVQAALEPGAALAARREESIYVVWTGEDYALATEFDLDTWWQGASVKGELTPDGEYTPAE